MEPLHQCAEVLFSWTPNDPRATFLRSAPKAISWNSGSSWPRRSVRLAIARWPVRLQGSRWWQPCRICSRQCPDLAKPQLGQGVSAILADLLSGEICFAPARLHLPATGQRADLDHHLADCTIQSSHDPRCLLLRGSDLESHTTIGCFATSSDRCRRTASTADIRRPAASSGHMVEPWTSNYNTTHIQHHNDITSCKSFKLICIQYSSPLLTSRNWPANRKAG